MRLMYSILKWFSNKDLLYIRRLITEILANKLAHDEQSKLFWDHNGYARNLNIAVVNPSKDDLNIYKKYLTNEDNNKKVLLLGSTPLLRNLLNEAGFRNYVVADFSFTTIESSLRTLDKLNINVDIDNEIWLKSDWLEMPLEPESFDYIVGDMVFTQIEPYKQQLFAKKLASLLKNKGAFIVKMCLCNTNSSDKDPQQIIEGKLSAKNFENTARQRLELLYRLRNRLRDKESQITSVHAIVHELLQYKTTNNKRLSFIKSMLKMLSKRAEINLPFITQTKDELEKNILRFFSLDASASASDYPSNDFPIYIYVLKK